MAPDAPQPDDADRGDTLAMTKLLYFQFFVLTGLVAFALPGQLALEGAPIGDFLSGFYGAVLCMHAVFLWRLWIMEPRFRGHYLAVLSVVVVVPWASWAASRYLSLDAGLTGAALFVLIVIASFFLIGARGHAPSAAPPPPGTE